MRAESEASPEGRSNTATVTRLAALRAVRVLPVPFSSVWEIEDDRVVIRLKGELDLGSIAVFANCVAGIAFIPTQKVVFDFAELEFIDSKGLQSIAAIARQAAAYGVSVTIRSPGQEVQRLLDLFGFKRIVTNPAVSFLREIPGGLEYVDSEL